MASPSNGENDRLFHFVSLTLFVSIKGVRKRSNRILCERVFRKIQFESKEQKYPSFHFTALTLIEGWIKGGMAQINYSNKKTGHLTIERKSGNIRESDFAHSYECFL